MKLSVVVNGNGLKTIMIRKNLSTFETATRIGISQQFFYELMYERKHPSPNTCKKIQAAFKGMKWETLFRVVQYTTTSANMGMGEI